MTYTVLIDTCVWLDLAKDARQLPIINALGDLTNAGEISLIVPDVVRSEFERNKDSVAERAQKSLKSHFRLLKDSIESLADDEMVAQASKAILEVDRRIKVDSQDVIRTIQKIEELFTTAKKPAISTRIKEKLAERALAGKAPFHTGKNSSADALLIEIYSDQMKGGETKKAAFVTHNYRDFSNQTGDRRDPHKDLMYLFDGDRSSYWISLPSLLEHIDPDLLPNAELEFSGWDEARRLSEILDAEHLLFRQIWYNRHWKFRDSIENGEIQVVTEEQYRKTGYRSDQIVEANWQHALVAAKRTEQEVGKENLGPWDDFEWGMLNGKLSALRWVLGDDWDMLDT